MKNSEETMKEIKYKKRSGTSGIRGQLYETKLISLIHFRAKHDADVTEYYLATNVDEIGTFDDICLKTKVTVNGKDKSVAIFIQAKHREGDKVLTLNSKNDLAKYFDSYLNIRRAFKPGNKDVLFKGNFQEIDCYFVMYTTAKDDSNIKPFESDFADKLNKLICTGDQGLQPHYKDEEVKFLCEIIMKEQFATLAKQFAKFLCENDGTIMSMNDDLVLLYHIILVQKVVDVSEVQLRNEGDEHRVASFRSEFFESNEEIVVIFKNILYIEMLKNRKLDENETNTLLLALFNKPSDITILSELMGNVITYNKNGKLEFVNKSISDDFKRQLDKINILQATVDEAIELAAKDLLEQRQFKVLPTFGNKDLTIRGKVDVNIENILDNLKQKIVDLLHEAPDNIVTIDDSLGDEFLQHNAGIASAVGNILVSDENSNVLKFTDNYESLDDLAKRLFAKIQSEIQHLHVYRFHVNVKLFPKHYVGTNDESLETFGNQVTALGEYIGRFLCEKDDPVMSLDNEFVLRYHVILGQTVMDVSDIKRRNEDEEHRIVKFRQEFFESKDEFVLIFRNALLAEVLKYRKIEENNKDNLWAMFFKQPSEIATLSKIIGTVITYKHGKFEFIINTSEDSKRLLNDVTVSQSTIDAAIDLAAKEILQTRKFKVVASFGNKDLTIRVKKGLKIEKRLEHLNNKIADLIKKSNSDKIVVFEESLGDGLLKTSGGIAGLVGNMFVSDETTRLMKFTDNWESLGDLSKRLYEKLQSKFHNIHEYKFDVKVKKFPKLSFERSEHDENLVKDFLKKLLFYTNQADERDVGEYLKDEIDHQCNNVNNFRIGADAIYLKYHDEIQKWWMLPKEASYLTKHNKYFENAVLVVDKQPLLTVLSMMHTMKIKNHIEITFNENAINSLQVDACPPATIFIANSCAITVAKMLQCLKNKDVAVLDLEYILNLQANDHIKVCNELTKANKMKILIIVGNNIINNRNWCKKLESIAKAVDGKETVIVTNKLLENNVMVILKQCFKTDYTVKDEKSSLIDMSEESQNSIIQYATMIYQGVEVILSNLIDEHSMEFVEGDVLNKIINNEPITLGKPISSINYENVKHLYIDRRVIKVDHLKPNIRFRDNGDVILSLFDIKNDVALLTAKPGMGKSTLLTHLSHNTRIANPKAWIVRINLLDHCAEFSGWQERKTDINALETLKFMCKIILTDINCKVNDLNIILEETDDAVMLKECTADEGIIFELKMFLDYYNRKELIFLFDGFDEICPHYENEVLSLLRAVRNYSRKHKMWVTSRSYDEVKSILEKEFGTSYEIQQFSGPEQNIYLQKFWKSNIMLKDFDNDQFNNVCNFMEFMSGHYHNIDLGNRGSTIKKEKHQVLFIKVCLNFLDYLKNEMNACPQFVKDTFNNFFGDCKHEIILLENFDTPLHLYLISEYFLNQIQDPNKILKKWDLNINAFTVYDRFFETKLKKIRFQEKNKIDLHNPDNMIIYEEVKAEFFAKHKRLGAYAVFYNDVDKILDAKEKIDVLYVLERIKKGKEKTGLIHSIGNGIPIFTHMTFTEYFAVEFVCDLLKAESDYERRRSIWDFILNVLFFKCSENVRNILAYKIKTEKMLRNVVYASEEIIFDLLLKQGKGVFTYYENDFSKELYLKIKLPLNEMMGDELRNFIPLLYKLKVKLTEEYLKDPTRSTPKIKRMKIMHSVFKKQKHLNQS